MRRIPDLRATDRRQGHHRDRRGPVLVRVEPGIWFAPAHQETFRLSWRKHAADFEDESRQLGGKVGILLRSLDEAEELFSDEIVEGVGEPEAFADIFGSNTLFDPDLVKLYR